MPQIKIDFYSVQNPEGYDTPFQALLQEVSERQPLQRTIEVSDGWAQLQTLTAARTFAAGVMVRSKTRDIPPIVSIAGDMRDVPLNPGEGLGGRTHFYYRYDLKILLLQRKYDGVRVGSFERYYQRMAGVTIELFPVVRLEEMPGLEGLDLIRKFIVKLAPPHARHYANAGYGVASIIDLADRFSGPIAEFTVSMEHKKGSLNKTAAVAFLRQLRRLAERSVGPKGKSLAVKKVVVVGLEEGDDEEKTLLLDLLQDKMTMTINVIDEDRLSDARCARALEQAYEQRGAELRQMFGQG